MASFRKFGRRPRQSARHALREVAALRVQLAALREEENDTDRFIGEHLVTIATHTGRLREDVDQLIEFQKTSVGIMQTESENTKGVVSTLGRLTSIVDRITNALDQHTTDIGALADGHANTNKNIGRVYDQMAPVVEALGAVIKRVRALESKRGGDDDGDSTGKWTDRALKAIEVATKLLGREQLPPAQQSH